MRRTFLAVLCAALLSVAGCQAPAGVETLSDSGARDDPETDQIGWESGYWYDDPVPVTTDDGLNESEREAVTARTMARIEQIREREFNSTVPVEVISRAEYRNRSRSAGNGGPTADPWNDQVWEALLLVGESDGSSEAIGDTLSSSVLGYYSAGSDTIVIVSPNDTPVVDKGTLSHELVHALQDQQFGLENTAQTQDTQLSTNGVIEGEANYIQQLYRQRCTRNWDCIETPSDDGSDGSTTGGGRNPGVLTVLLQPYVTGPRFIDQARTNGGWAAVDELHDNMPASSEQVIHPDRYPDDMPENVTVPDRSNDEWERFDHDPVGDTVGEASIFATMYHNGQTESSRYSYRSPISNGWTGDTVVPYRTDDGDGGYVWVTRWDSTRDARQFAEAYLNALRTEHGATRQTEDIYVVPEDSAFSDAFRIVRDGETVRIVNGPTVSDLDGIHRSGE